jgi:hypothetical protein
MKVQLATSEEAADFNTQEIKRSIGAVKLLAATFICFKTSICVGADAFPPA